MKRPAIFLLIGILCAGIGWAAYEGAVPAAPPLSKYVPAGALLYLEAKDFSSLLSDWNASSQKQDWLKSSNYEAFSRSRLFLRLKGASDEFAAAAGLPPDANFLSQMAGSQSVLALYDIGNLQFLYVTRLPSTRSMQTALWQSRATFEPRSVGTASFYLRRDPDSKKEVAFAISGDYVLLATREDLLAGALTLMSGGEGRGIESEPWWSQSVASAGNAGDLRMVLNLEKIVPSPYFRTYWIQQNITDMKRYSAAVTDLFRTAQEYREERVLLKAGTTSNTFSAENFQAVADLVRLVPDDAGLYEAQAAPSTESCLGLLESKLLAPHLGPPPPSQTAPEARLTPGETGAASDLETRIDEAPVQGPAAAQSKSSLTELLRRAGVLAMLHVQSTQRESAGVFVRMHSAVALAATSDWDDVAVRSALVDFVRTDLTASRLGMSWQQRSGYYSLDGLWPLMTAVRGKYLLVSDDSALMEAMLAGLTRKSELKPAVFVAGLSHTRERANFGRLSGVLDRPNTAPPNTPPVLREPQFFSDNLASLSSTLGGVSAENVVVRDAGDKVLQTVTYRWSQ